MVKCVLNFIRETNLCAFYLKLKKTVGTKRLKDADVQNDFSDESPSKHNEPFKT